MTTGNENRDGDKLVSERYRELSSERTPPHLDQRVLRMAASEQRRSGTGRLPFATWMKPAAWAATIGLSFAIVLEFVRLPTVSEGIDSVPALAGEVPSEMPADSPAAALEEEAINDRDAFEDTPARALQMAPPEAAKEDAVRLEIYERESTGETQIKAAPAQKSLLDARSAETEARKRRQESSANAPAALMSTSGDLQELDDASFCDERARKTQEDWLACIESLRQAGNVAAAEQEYEAYRFAFGVKNSGHATE